MSRILEIITTTPPRELGLVEPGPPGGGETLPSQIRQLEFEGIGVMLVPIADHVRLLLPPSLGGAACLSLDEQLLIEWAARRLTPSDADRLHRFLDAVARDRSWAIVLEADAGQGQREVEAGSRSLFETVDELIRDPSGWDLTVITPASRSSTNR